MTVIDVRLGPDRRPYFYHHNAETTSARKWDGKGLVIVKGEVFGSYLFCPKEAGDTFELLGHEFIFIKMNYASDEYICIENTPENNRFFMFWLNYITETYVWWLLTRAKYDARLASMNGYEVSPYSVYDTTEEAILGF